MDLKTHMPAAGTNALRWGLVLLAVVAVVYAPALTGERIWDDHLLLEGNPVVAGRVPWSDAFAQPFHPFEAYYRPATALLLRGLLALGGGATWPFHLTSLLLHACVTGLIYLLARGIRLDRPFAFGAAAIFALHPALTESVAWISGLGDLLAAAFMGAAAWLFLRGAGTAGPGMADRWKWTALSAAGFALALLSKETALALPFCLCWTPLFFPERPREAASELEPAPPGAGSPARSKAPRRMAAFLASYLLLLIGYGVLRSHALAAPLYKLLAVTGAAAGNAEPDVVFRPALRLVLLGKYAALFFAPLHLNLYHVLVPPRGAGDPRLWLGFAVLLAGGVWAAATARLHRPALLGAAWFLLTLAPAVLFTPQGTNLFAERYLYIPAMGLVLWLAGGLQGWVRGRGARRRLAIAAAAWLLLSAVLTARRAAQWREETPLLEATLRQEPRAAAAAVNLGLSLRRAGRIEEALNLYQRTLRAVEREPRPILTSHGRVSLLRVAYEMGTLLAQQGATQEAEAAFRRALAYDDTDERALGSLGALLGRAGRYGEARPILEHGIAVHPQSQLLRRNLALCLRRLGDVPAARVQYQALLRLSPGDPEATQALRELADPPGR